MIPRPVVVIVVLVFLGVVVVDVGAQFVVPDHQASPELNLPIIALIAAVVTGSKGPKPDVPSAAPPEPEPERATPRSAGRHRGEEDA